MNQKLTIICLTLLLLIVNIQSTLAQSIQMSEKTETQGAFNVAIVEDLALYFAEESVRKLRVPLTLRVVAAATGEKISKKEEIAKIRANPPKANEKGVVYPFGKNNPLSFVYNSHNGTMTVYERFIKKKGAVGFYGLTAVELALELNQATSRKKRANADFAFDATSDALSLKLDYTTPPKSLKKFYKEVNRIIKAQLKWTNSERFLKEGKAAAERHKPPETATAELDGFRAHLVLRHFSVYPQWTQLYTDRYVKGWDRKPSAYSPKLVSDKKFWIQQILSGFIHFQGAENAADGKADVQATFKLIDPDGKVEFENQVVPLWQFESPPAEHLQIGMNNLSFSMDGESKLGLYRIEAQVCDQVAQNCVDLKHDIELLKP